MRLKLAGVTVISWRIFKAHKKQTFIVRVCLVWNSLFWWTPRKNGYGYGIYETSGCQVCEFISGFDQMISYDADYFGKQKTDN